MIPKNAIELVTTFEGYRPVPYLCPAGVPTIGYGSTVYPDGRKVKLSDPPISRDTAIFYMKYELERKYNSLAMMCPVLLSNEMWMGAILDFVFNLGAGRLQQSTLRRKINAKEWGSVPGELNKWVYAGGKKLKGLVLRRAAEAQYFK